MESLCTDNQRSAPKRKKSEKEKKRGGVPEEETWKESDQLLFGSWEARPFDEGQLSASSLNSIHCGWALN